MSKRLILLTLVALLALVLGFVTFTPTQAVAAVRKIGYWFIFGEFALFAVYFWRSFGSEVKALSLRTHAGSLALILGGSLFLHLHDPHAIKIMADDAVMNSTAYNMHFDRDPTMLLRAFDVGGNFVPTVVFLDKRPLFFPFLVSVVHDLSGYRFENVFWLNGAFTVILLASTFLVGRKLAGGGGGVLAVLLMVSIPLVAQNATGAGFEIVNMTMIVITLWLAIRLVEAPSDDRLSTLLIAGVLLAQTRYESVVFLAPVAGTVLYLALREKRLRLPPVTVAFPLLLILIPLQNNVFKISKGSWQLGDIKGATTVFGPQYFYDNVGHALSFFLSFDGVQPSSWWVALLGALGVGLTVLFFYRQYRTIFTERPVYAVWMIFFGGLLLHTALMLCYFWGHWDDPIIRRLSLPCHLLLIFSFVGICTQLIPHRRRWTTMIGLTVAYVVAFTIPASARHRFTTENIAARVAQWTHEFAKTQSGRKVVALDRNCGAIWLMNQQAALTADALSSRTDQLLYHYKVHTFDDIFVVQRITVDLKTGTKGIMADDDAGPACKLETVKETKFGVGYFVRIARVVSIDEAALRTWAAEKHAEKALPESQRTQIHLERVSENEWFQSLP